MDNTRLPKHALNYIRWERRDRGRPSKNVNALMPEQVKRPNPCRNKMMMMMMMMILDVHWTCFGTIVPISGGKKCQF
jgi:hypothetical protein